MRRTENFKLKHELNFNRKVISQLEASIENVCEVRLLYI